VLIADQVVVNEGFEGPSTGPIEERVKKNAKALMTSDYGPISKSPDCGVSKKKKKKVANPGVRHYYSKLP
jgi:hypothetical protein